MDEARLPAAFIDFDGSSADVWHRIVRMAVSRGQLPELVAVTAKDHPQSAGRLVTGLFGNNDRYDGVTPSDDNGDKLDEIWGMCYRTSERVTRLEVWMMAITIGVVLTALVVMGRLVIGI